MIKPIQILMIPLITLWLVQEILFFQNRANLNSQRYQKILLIKTKF